MDCYCKKNLTKEPERLSEELIEVRGVVDVQLSWFPFPQRFLFLVWCQFPFSSLSNKSLKVSLTSFFMSLFYTWVLLWYPDLNVPIGYDIRYGKLTWEVFRREITQVKNSLMSFLTGRSLSLNMDLIKFEHVQRSSFI